jgi:hypothetical protein
MTALGTRLLQVSVGGTDYTAEVSKVVITSGESDSDFVTFADAAAGGGREYRLEFTAVQDLAADTLWDQVFSTPGEAVAILIKPLGNASPTTAAPHITANAVISEPDGDFIGGEADSSVTAKMTFECSWVLTGKPSRVTV